MPAASPAAILVVDDSPEKRLALEAVLADLPVRVVAVATGREALRRLLDDDFAVILLDVRMPEMDGFETAALIRSRPRSERTPIIFVTAFGDETHEARGYSLKAVDYLMAPISPEILRTKVSVLVELYGMTTRVQEQAESMRRRAEQLHRLTTAAMAINAAPSIERMAHLAVEAARDIVAAPGARLSVQTDDRRTHHARAGRDGTVGETVRTRLESTGQPSSRWAGHEDGVLERGFAVSLSGHDGQPLGLLEVAARADGRSFEDADRDVLVQLAHIASIAVENVLSFEAREANRLKDEFLATVSHELRTPLSAILSWAEILRRGGPASPAAGRAVEAIERNARAQARLVDDLLDVSRIVTGKLLLERRPLALDAVVRSAAEALVGTATAKGVTLVTRVEEHALSVRGDGDRLQQVVTNLLGNAIKFTPAGGRVELTLAAAGGEAVLRVRDTGAGIPGDFLPYVFDRFRQIDGSTRRQAGGLGLGLAIVRNLVELHGGSVAAESAGEGQGATFVVRLPIAASGAAAEPSALGERPDLQGVDVLVVEDEPDIRDALCLTVAEAGASVRAVGSAAEAMEALGAALPDLLICDIGLPVEDGYVLLDKVRALPGNAGRTLPAIALTAYARPDDRRAALAAGFQAHLAKPVEPETLLRTLALHAPSHLPPGAGGRATPSPWLPRET